ncbi:MAG: hypothetical protein AAF353_16950 [Pseudomonadota bacterium]
MQIEVQNAIALTALNTWFSLNAEWQPLDQAVDLNPPYLLPLEEFEKRAVRAEKKSVTRKTTIPETATYVKPDYGVVSWPHLTMNTTANIRPSESPYVSASVLSVGDILHLTGYASGSIKTQGDTELSLRLERQSAENRLAGFLQASKVQVGDVFNASQPLISRSGAKGTGFTVQRGPLKQLDGFDTTELVGDAPPGWQIELHRDSSLLSLQDVPADGRYVFNDVPLAFGANRFRFELYGPSGERRTVERIIDVNNKFIRPGEFQYNISAIDRNTSIVDLALDDESDSDSVSVSGDFNPGVELNAGVGYGVNQNFTLRGNAVYSRPDNLDARIFASFGQTVNVKGMLLDSAIALSSRGGWANRIGIASKVKSVSLTLDRSEYKDFESGSTSVGSDQILRRWSGRISGNINTFNWSASASRETRSSGVIENRARLRASSNFSWVAVTNSINHRLRVDPSSANEETLSVNSSVSGRIKRVRTRASIDWNLSPAVEVRRARGELSMQIQKWFHQASISRDFETAANSYGLRTTRNWNGVRMSGELKYNDNSKNLDARVSVALTVDKSPTHGGVRLGREAVSKSGTVKLTGYYDENNNGMRDSNETNLNGLEFKVSERGRITSGENYTLVEELPVDRMLGIAVGPGVVDDPYLAPTVDYFKTQARPGGTQSIDVPFFDTGEAIVTLLNASQGPVANKVAVLKNAVTGRQYKSRSAFDGEVYFRALIPGQYQLIVDGVTSKTVSVLAGDVNYLTATRDLKRNSILVRQQHSIASAQSDDVAKNGGEFQYPDPVPLRITESLNEPVALSPIQMQPSQVTFTEQPADAEHKFPVMIVQKQWSIIRAEPYFNGKIITSLAKGTVVETSDRHDDWYYILAHNVKSPVGFMHKSTIARSYKGDR